MLSSPGKHHHWQIKEQHQNSIKTVCGVYVVNLAMLSLLRTLAAWFRGSVTSLCKLWDSNPFIGQT